LLKVSFNDVDVFRSVAYEKVIHV